MLVSFTLENFLSFRDEITFSMVASKEKQHRNRLPKIKKPKNSRLLPIAAIYGGNTSGKTNLFKAFAVAKNQIVKGTEVNNLIFTEPFLLDPACHNKPSKFVFVIVVKDKCYEYGFSMTPKEIIEEWLTEILPNSEKKLFHRNKDDFQHLSDNDLQTISRGTRPNQLFLTNTIDQRNETFKEVYDWFYNDLFLITPDMYFSRLENFFQEKTPLYQSINNVLSLLDTGINNLKMKEIPLESLPFPAELKKSFKESMKENEFTCLSPTDKERYLVTKKDGNIIAYKLFSVHLDSEQNEITFELHGESDGTLRFIDIFPMFFLLSYPTSAKVVIIDEIDRSLHTLMIRQLLESYLASCSENSKNQLLFTTHDVMLMNQDLLRRDEMWITERDQSGNSSIFSFSDYKDIRYDKDIRKSYLLGMLGGIPNITLQGPLPNPKKTETKK